MLTRENIVAVSPMEELPWHENTEEDFENSISRCDIKVEITAASQTQIKDLLYYDKKANGALGRALIRDIPQLGLLKDDRLEPSANLPDVGKFGSLEDLPVEITFWRVSNQLLVYHRNPLMSAELGVTYSLSPAIDCLHTLYLGPFKVYCMLVLWSLLNARVWGSVQLTVAEGLQLAVHMLRGDLWAWYKERHEKFPTKNLTRLADLTPKMLGTPEAPLLKTQGAET